ncbi:HEAT repeat domain-containing protein [bacterium]|jgi:hypothetical protein|nr:HEAT repeat domain-containing protein [bacterium]
MMDQFRGEVAEYILEILLMQYHRGGKIDSFEYSRWDRISPEVRISRSQFDAVVQKVKLDYRDPAKLPKFDQQKFLEEVENRVLVLTTKAETQRILEKIEQFLVLLRKSESLPTPEKSSTVAENSSISSTVQEILDSENPHKLRVLRDLLARVTDVQQRYEIRKAIDALEDSSPPKEVKGSQEFDEILKNLRSDLEDVRRKAMGDIARENRQEFLDVMLKIEEETNEAYLKACILKLLPRSDLSRQELIHRYLVDSDFRIVANAIEALEQVGGTAALARISTFASHPDNRVKANALTALHRLGQDKILSLFEKMIHSEHSAYRDSAAYAICTLKDSNFIPLLIQLLQDPSQSVKDKAYHGLKFLAFQGHKQAEEALASFEPDPVI